MMQNTETRSSVAFRQTVLLRVIKAVRRSYSRRTRNLKANAKIGSGRDI